MQASLAVPALRYEAERLSDGQRYALKVTELNALSQLDKVAVRIPGCCACCCFVVLPSQLGKVTASCCVAAA